MFSTMCRLHASMFFIFLFFIILYIYVLKGTFPIVRLPDAAAAAVDASKEMCLN